MKNDTYRVQRLTAQVDRTQYPHNQGPQPDRTGWKKVFDAFQCDYMGAAEYEFGSVPESLKRLAADSKSVVGGVFTLKDEITPNYKRTRIARTTKGTPRKKQPVHAPVTPKNVYFICRQGDSDEVRNRIRLLAQEKIRTKMGNGFALALDPIEDDDRRTIGWFEIDNDFLFFLDEKVYTQVLNTLQSL